MPEPLTSYVADCYNQFLDARWDCANAWTDVNTAGIRLKLGNMAGAGDALQAAYLDGRDLALILHARYGFHLYYLIDALEWIDDNWPSEPEPPELTMDAILSTMLAADPKQVEYFVGIVDAYRQSVWNRPFNQEFFTALGRGFMQWP